MDISNLPCPNGLWIHGTFNVLNVLEHQTEMNVQFGLEYWKLVLFVCSPRGSCRSKVLPYHEDSIRESAHLLEAGFCWGLGVAG
jgi:hypothetical protein